MNSRGFASRGGAPFIMRHAWPLAATAVGGGAFTRGGVAFCMSGTHASTGSALTGSAATGAALNGAA